MFTPDLINASFEVFGIVMGLLNIRQILKDKMVAGVSLLPTLFYASWGIWNIWYYPHLGQPISASVAVVMVAVNIWWLVLARKYSTQKVVA